MSARPSALDRACSEIAYLIQRTLRRQLRPAGRLAREVARLRQQGPRPEVAGLRYRLRRDGFEPALLAEYETMRASFKGIAISRLNGNHCGACHLDNSRTSVEAIKAAPGELHECEQCGRWLVA